jgi:ectoine hydroxylase-related dioxygenase (phytanoyl-CoA dioxygenase family)
VRWHQDVTLCVSERIEIPGWGPWSAKQGLPHVQAPARVLAQMLSLRLHVDANTRETGALRVISGTHRLGRLSQQDIDRLRATQEAEICEGPAGSVLVMRPLLLHASSPAARPSHRRVLHFEFAPDDLLPSGLSWAQEA